MKAIELKKDLHQLIESTENTDLLRNWLEIIKRASTSSCGDLWNMLTLEQQKELLELDYNSSKESEILIFNEVKAKYSKWL